MHKQRDKWRKWDESNFVSTLTVFLVDLCKLILFFNGVIPAGNEEGWVR